MYYRKGKHEKTEDKDMKKGLKAIGAETMRLWYGVNEKYGSHKYTLAVNGLDEVTLQKG